VIEPMQRSPRFLASAAGVLVVLLLGSGVYLRLRSADAAESTEDGGETAAAIATSARAVFTTDIAIPVEGRTVERGVLVLGVTAAGQAEAWRRTLITAQVAGRVSAVPVDESRAVAAGTLLVRLDAAEYQLAVETAEANLRDAEAKYREQTLFDDRITDAAARTDRERVIRSRSGLDNAEVALRRAKLELARTRLTAPFPGRIADLKVVPGQWVAPGEELMTLVDIDPIRVEVQVLEGEVGFLSPGRAASVSFAAFPGEQFRGRIETINPVVASGTRTARVTVVIPNPDARIFPGMYARVALDAREFADRVMVPRAAILERDRRTMLFVYEGDEGGGRAKWRYVTTGLENDSVVEILSNVETDSVRAGEVVLVDGHYTLVHDARVRVVENVAASGGRPD
jgi:membrane fusion protein, multidrug efflux system